MSSPQTTPSPPATASPLYKTMHATAIEFIESQTLDPTQPTRMSTSRIRAIRSPNFTHSWGHNYHVSITPPLRGTLSVDDFIAHLESMTPRLESWDTIITDMIVDEAKLSVVVRASYHMHAKGAEEKVENDLVWFLDMEQGGKRVQKGMEFIDAMAGARLRELMQGGGGKG
ncbi:hypothetical protein K504DRAFT_495012 [Pleomassaria siparia CBS 279.74]|uniref:SnoaL-like domain-containing protein n=1 Tax=Pleomassaria siparia CBS 279.74 TaxID=1314801 RepID=A0A6G1JVT5_9PLEO|nr:hypothetical protein K504DRAFT_495012 [Pleomassaria siparia CBS 279.74]